MCEGQAIQGIIGGILAIVGILLAIISSGIWFRRVKIRVGFLGIGLALSGVGLFILITSFPQYAIGFSVLATLALAFAAFLTIKEADAREERHREEELAKEKRDRDERLLNEIIEWATDTAQSALRRRTIIIQQRIELLPTKMEYKFSKAKSGYISEIVSMLFDDLSPYLKNVITKLDEAIDVITQYLDEKKQVGLSDLRNSEKDLTESVEKLIAEVAKIKVRDIG